MGSTTLYLLDLFKHGRPIVVDFEIDAHAQSFSRQNEQHQIQPSKSGMGINSTKSNTSIFMNNGRTRNCIIISMIVESEDDSLLPQVQLISTIG